MKKRIFDEYFSFSSSEKRSILIISILILLGIIATSIVKYIPQEKGQFSEEQREEINKLVKELSENDKPEDYSEAKNRKNTRTLFPFDPNSATTKELEKIGLSERQIRTIRNYLSSGGKFYHKEDFRKIYTISEEEYLIYEPYIKIENSVQTPIKKEEEQISEGITHPENNSEFRKNKVELNSAEFYELTIVKGIGKVYGNRMLKYRDLLGGFYKKEQLMEVYGINDTVYNNIISQIEIDTSLVRTIDLNSALYKDLIRHPYLDSYNTQAILNYRDFKKKKIKKEDLLRNNILSKEVFAKVSPYLEP